MKEEVCKNQPTTKPVLERSEGSLGENWKIPPYPKNKGKELTQAQRAELLSDPFISHQIEKIIYCLNKISAIWKEEGKDASLDEVWAFAVSKIKEELAGVEEGDFTKEEIDVLSEIGFYKEVLKKVMKAAKER